MYHVCVCHCCCCYHRHRLLLLLLCKYFTTVFMSLSNFSERKIFALKRGENESSTWRRVEIEIKIYQKDFSSLSF
jgi:hypothetical protein